MNKRIWFRSVCLFVVLGLLWGCAPVHSSVDAESPVSPLESPSPAPSPPLTPAPTPTPTPTPTPAPTPPPEARIQMAGDVLLHIFPINAARTGTDTYNFKPFFSDVKPYLTGDLVMCNMEGPIDVNGGNQGITTFPLFNAPNEIAEAVRDAGFNYVVAGNNHSYDKKLAGLIATQANLAKAGLEFTGIYSCQEEFENQDCLSNINGIPVAVLNYTQDDNGLSPWIPEDVRPYTLRRFTGTMDSLPAMAEDIERVRAQGARFVILALHWGTEYQNKPSSAQTELAQALCDAGADMIWGAHPHVCQPVVWVDAKDGRRCLVAYSTGNFFADQTAMNPPNARTQYGMVLDIVIRDTGDAIEWVDASCLPTLTARFQNDDDRRDYRVFPIPEASDELSRPDIFPSDSLWSQAKKAYAHIDSLAGESVRVGAAG